MEGRNGAPILSGLKNRLRKRDPEFSEKTFGYGGFLQFVKAAQARGSGRVGVGLRRRGLRREDCLRRMSETADVVVVGAGIIGSSIAYQIARRSPLRVVVLEKGAGVAEGSTGASSSIVRCKYTHPEVVRLARHGQEAYGDWSAFTGLDSPRSGLQRAGVLWLMGDPAQKVEDDADRLEGQGVAVTILDADELTSRFPDFSTCGVPFDLTGETPHTCAPGDAFLYEDEGGYADPSGANQDLADAARREGAEIRFGTAVTAVGRQGNRVPESPPTRTRPSTLRWSSTPQDRGATSSTRWRASHCAGPSTPPGSRSSTESCPREWDPSR